MVSAGVESGVKELYSLSSTKSNSGGTDHVWFYDMKADGKSLDDKRSLLVDEDLFEKFSRGEGTEELTEKQKKELQDKFNLPDIIARYPNRNNNTEKKRKRTEQNFIVPFKEIKENDWDLSINRYKEIVYQEVEYDDPGEIIERIKTLSKEKDVVLKALTKHVKKN